MTDRERVVIAMSGGVDSSVAAALLVQQGYAVIGMMLRLWSEDGREGENRCCTPDAVAQARRVAAILGIPFYVIDGQQIFYKTVVHSFLNGYAKGMTPNPCLVCNRHIRWGFLLEHARSIGAQYLATGHYVRLRRGEGGDYQIWQAVDSSKDQSYVLHMLSQAQLARSLFPISEYSKSEIRTLAEDLSLPVAQRPDSQDLCFLGGDDYRAFIERNSAGMNRPGAIVSPTGEQIGEHKGLAFYTIGQRKGLGLNSPIPLYVIDKDPRLNTLVVGSVESLGKKELYADEFNWIAGIAPGVPFRAQIKIRYKAKPAWGVVSVLSDQRVHIRFDEQIRDITPGQAAVIYDGERCLGGGQIRSDWEIHPENGSVNLSNNGLPF